MTYHRAFKNSDYKLQMAYNFDIGMSVWYSRNSVGEEDSAQNVFFVNVKSIFTIKFLFSRVLNTPTSRLCSTAVKTVVKFQNVLFTNVWLYYKIARILGAL